MVMACNHSVISGLWFVLSIAGLVRGSLYSLYIRLELGFPSMSIHMTWEMYNHSVTLHGIIMIFGFIMPMLFSAFGNLLVPLILGTSEVAYCRLNNASLIIYFISLLYIVIGLCTECLVGMGWTFYPPLSTTGSFVLATGVAMLLGALLIMGVSSTFSSINFM
jgi:cytochrome c oxidase subunit 1